MEGTSEIEGTTEPPKQEPRTRTKKQQQGFYKKTASGKHTKKGSDTEEQIDAIKRQNIEQQGEINRLNQTIKETEKKAKALTSQNMDLKKKNAELTRENSRLKSQISLSQTATLKQTINKLEDERKKLKTDIKNKEKQLQDAEAENANMQRKIQDLEKDIDELNRPLDNTQDLQGELQDAQEIIEALYAKIKEYEECGPQEDLEIEDPTPHTNLLIADSNRRQIHPNLTQQGIEWDHTEEIFTIDMLDDCLSEEAYIQKEYDSIYIMMGTNDIRHGKDGMKAAKKLTRIVKQLAEGKPVCPEPV